MEVLLDPSSFHKDCGKGKSVHVSELLRFREKVSQESPGGNVISLCSRQSLSGV